MKTAKRKTSTKVRQRKKAARRASAATTRSTAGTGFAFEDKVAAALLLQSLAGQPLPGVEGAVVRLQMQTDKLGWLIDDVLFTTEANPGDQRHLAVSCKDNIQVTASSLPADFVEGAWRQWSQSQPMVRGKDRLMLATRGRKTAFERRWADLKLWAPDSDKALTLGKIRASAAHQRLFESVKVPASNAGVAVSESDVLPLLASVEVMPFEFDVASSRDEAAMVGLARTLLTNGTSSEGRRLWRRLVRHARDTRLGSGTLEVTELRRGLRQEFRLKDFPDFAPSWVRLRALTRDQRQFIETALPTGASLRRETVANQLIEKLSNNAVCIVHGDSGSGKSSLVKAVLDEHFPDTAQIWFEPERLRAALNESAREELGLSYPLTDVLDGTAHPKNVLVIDGADRLGEDGLRRSKALIAELLARNGSGRDWQIVVVGQTEGWAQGQLQDLANVGEPADLEVEPLTAAEVGAALQGTPGLAWLTAHPDAIEALRNLKTLAWVVQAASRFDSAQGGDGMTLAVIADRLWSYWSNDNVAMQRLLMRFAERDAAFEHSFAVSQLEAGDAQTYATATERCPLRRSAESGRIRFEHDLAADWARFQQLKEIAHDISQWAPLAANPRWNAALRMLGQYLLRKSVGQLTAWDVAFEAAERASATLPLALDILLDALCLDPQAERLLNERAEMLLANNASRLQRLLARFDHMASAPSANEAMIAAFPDLALYFESHYRVPIVGRWPGLARFLARYKERVAQLISPAVSALCERWLATVPASEPGRTIPLRKEFAEIALATVRALQLEQAKGVMISGDFETKVYQAAFAAAGDLPVEVADWALEMAARRPLRSDLAAEVAKHRKQEAEARAQRMADDPTYRERMERARNVPTFIPSGQRLPPWELGPKRRIDHHFRKAILGGPHFSVLIRACPDVASEILLAALIEDSPEEEYGDRAQEELGLAYDDDGYPTAYWKSPYFLFLQINPDVALASLIKLIDFCTSRWEKEVRRKGSTPYSISVALPDAIPEQYQGNAWLFRWSHEDSNFIGSLHSALAALEKWLCDLVDRGADVSAQIETLLRSSRSVAILGVLVNVGKHRSELFKGPLRPLLAVEEFYWWDDERIRANEASFAVMTWAASGDRIFNMAQNQANAPYRKRKLRTVVAQLVRTDRALATEMLEATGRWQPPQDAEEALRSRLLVAELNYQNYAPDRDGEAGRDGDGFLLPEALARDLAQQERQTAREYEARLFPERCRQFLARRAPLTATSAAAVAALMVATDGDEEIELTDEMKRPARVAAAVALLLRGQDWLAGNEPVQRRARAIIEREIREIASTDDTARFRYSMAPSYLEFVARLAVEEWIALPSRENGETVMLLFTSGDDRAAQAISWLAYWHRDDLGPLWWRFLRLTLFWAAVSALAPRYDERDELGTRWQKWRRWIRTRNLASVRDSNLSIDPLKLAEGVERLSRDRAARRKRRDGWGDEQGRHVSQGLNTHYLELAFAWLFDPQTAQAATPTEAEWRRKLVSAFWAFVAWRQKGSASNAKDDYEPLGHLGYAIVAELARLIMILPAESGRALWMAVIDLGPFGHYAIRRFLEAFFGQISETTSSKKFGERWKPMVDYLLSREDWVSGRGWYHGENHQRQALGFGAAQLERLAGHAELVASMREQYMTWAEKRLTRNEDNIAGLCGFLSGRAGRLLRLDGVAWIAAAMRENPDVGKWHRERTSSAFMEFLDTMVNEHANELVKDSAARQDLLYLVAHAVSRQLPAAFALQERVRRLGS